MPGWLTWFVSRFLFLMGFHHQHYKHNRFFGLDPPSTVHTHICLWKHEITSTYVRIFTDVINKHILYIKHTRSLHLYLWLYHKNPHGVFVSTPTPSWGSPFFSVFCGRTFCWICKVVVASPTQASRGGLSHLSQLHWWNLLMMDFQVPHIFLLGWNRMKKT